MTFKASNDLEDFVGKIDWEGGVTSALDYGLRTADYELPEEIEETWEELRDAFAVLSELENDFWAAVRRHGVSY